MAFNMISCPLCDAPWEDQSALFEKQFRHGSHKIVKCEECGLIFVNPQPTEAILSQIYSKDYFKSKEGKTEGYGDYMGNEREYRVQMGYRCLGWVEALADDRDSRLLDVGCAAGFFLKAAAERGWSVRGVEISEFAAGFARHEMDLDVACGTLSQAAYSDNEFDVVTMFDVIEHCPNPKEQIRECRRLLRPGGLIFIDTPNIESRTAIEQGENFWLLKADHLLYFSPDTISRLLCECGFIILKLGKRPVSKWDKAKRLFPDSHEGSHVTIVARKAD
jgi:spore maturation protein CgeB